MRVAVGADHGGYPLKSEIIAVLRGVGHEVIDLGAHTLDPGDDYPDFAHAVAAAVAGGKAERGVVICGSGVGASVVANKTRGVRAGLCHDTYSAHQGVEHDDMNVLCLGARIIGSALAAEIVQAFAGARFSGEERHQRRLAKLRSFE
jgi:ribose 5-phosphate isomerase B